MMPLRTHCSALATGFLLGAEMGAEAQLIRTVWNPAANPLPDLLREPNLPKLSSRYGDADGGQVWPNRQRFVSQERIGRSRATQPGSAATQARREATGQQRGAGGG